MTPRSFNWVEARSKCTPELQFQLLEEQVQSDVEAFQKLASQSRYCTLDRTHEKLIISRSMNGIPDSSVVCQLSKEAISFTRKDATGNRTLLFTAIPHLLDDLGCQLEVDGVPLALWQVSRRAFEGLFFG